MTYKETIEYLFSSLPMFQRIGDAAIKKDLTNIRKLSALLEDPHLAFASIHIAGTNGKGSTSHMLASICQAAGMKVGLYTSPHYIDFRERIKVNGIMISKKEVISFVKKYRHDWEKINPSFFEITVAMAFDHFRNQQVDIAIIETGLGGRLDSTNIITPLLSVITNIGYDHMQMLGNTLPEIAQEKAGIIKKDIPVVIGECQEETTGVFKAKAVSMNAPLYFASEQYLITGAKEKRKAVLYDISTRTGDFSSMIKTDLTGPYQGKNLLTVLEACRVWNHYYPQNRLPGKAIMSGLKKVRKNTNMIGRWMVINQKPLVIADAAHNVEGINNIMPRINKIKAASKHFVLGFVSDKDIKKILTLFPLEGKYYWCRPDIPRGKPTDETREEGKEVGLKGRSYPTVLDAYKAACSKAKKKDFIFIGGSSYVVGDLLAGTDWQ